MNTILLFGEAQDHTLRNALLPALERYGGVLYAGERQIFRLTTEKPAFFVYDCERLPELYLDKGILLFKGSCTGNSPLSLPDGFCCVLESDNHRAAALLQNSHFPVVTCGMGAKDTLSVASLDDGNAVLSLQRSVAALDGRILEPHDFRVSICTGTGPKQILAVSMTLLLSEIESGEGYEI